MQCGDQFATEKILAGRHEGLGRQHVDGRIGKLGAAETRFPTPDRDDDRTGHAIGGLHLAKRRGMAFRKATAGAGEPLQALFGEIGAWRGKFRLALFLFLRRCRAGRHEIGKIPLQRNPAGRLVEQLAGYARLLRLGPEIVGEPCMEQLFHLGFRRRGVSGWRGKGEGKRHHGQAGEVGNNPL